MRTVEVALGLLVIATAVALALGAATLVAPIPPPGLGLTLAMSGLGATIAAHGMTGRARRASNVVATQNWRAMFYALLALTLAATLPLIVDLLDLITVAGFPLGYYMTAQGLLILLAIIAFRAATHLDSLDHEATRAHSREGE